MPRTCFVIMPFSSTASCTEDEWTKVFEEVFRPAVENAGLDFECRRSVATRGNLVAAILRDLSDAWVVLADLTDRNANVFYELGVRHTLKDRSIILAQRAEDIPFDLQAYARHVYDWKTAEGREALASKLKELLSEVDQNPSRPDNPVSDFLKRQYTQQPALSTPILPEETDIAQSLAGPGAEGLDAVSYARKLAHGRRSVAVILRLTQDELIRSLMELVRKLNELPVPENVQRNQVPAVAKTYIDTVEPTTLKIEEFLLASAEEDWSDGVKIGVRIAGAIIGLSEPSGGTHVKFARGLPALLAWRSLVLTGVKAVAAESFGALRVILNEPIEVKHYTGRYSHRPLPQSRDLFHPEVFLGDANRGAKYLASLWAAHLHLQKFFSSEKEYQESLAKFLAIVALVDAGHADDNVLYPMYRLIPYAGEAMASLCGRMAASDDYLGKVAESIGETREGLRAGWSQRVKRANEARLGGDFFIFDDGLHFPDPMTSQVKEW